MKLKEAVEGAGSIGFPSKMPGTSYGLSAHDCKTGGKLAKVPGSVCSDCYALKGNYIYPSVAEAHRRRMEALKKPGWVNAMATLIRLTQERGKNRLGDKIVKGWHRWHDSGDIQSVEHLEKICEVARQTPAIRHWLPTKELTMVLQHKKQGGVVPPNLMIRVSATMIDGPATKAWPYTSGVFDRVRPANEKEICPAPKNDNECGKCRACWSFDVPHMTYHRH